MGFYSIGPGNNSVAYVKEYADQTENIDAVDIENLWN